MSGKGMRSGLYGAIAIYLLAVHGLLFLALFRPHIIDDQRWRASWLRVEPDRQIAATHHIFRAIAADQPAGRLLLIGDSQMQRMDMSLLQQPALNFGIGGDNLASMAKRLKDYDYRARASAVVLWGGVNDLLGGSTPQDVAAVLNVARRHMPDATPLYVIAISPVSGHSEAGLGDRIARTNAILARNCRGSCQFIDTTRTLATPTGALFRAYDSGDGLHLNRRGHAQVAAVLNDVLARNASEQAGS